MQAKQKAMEELTQGQAMTLVRNEQVIDRSAEEAEDLEEMLNESIADSMRGAKQKAAGLGNEKKRKKRYGSWRLAVSSAHVLTCTCMQLGLSVLAITCSVMMKLLLELQGKAD